MGQEREKQLEGMLAAIQELKNEYYIGTGDAFVFLHKYLKIYSNPEGIAKVLNKRLKESGLENLSYPATAQRITGIRHTIVNISYENPLFTSDNWKEQVKLKGELIDTESDAFKMLYPDYDFYSCGIEEVADSFYGAFYLANKLKVNNDHDFGKELTNFYRLKFNEIGKQVKSVSLEIYENMLLLLRDLESIDWQQALSRQSQIAEERSQIRLIKNDYILLWKMVEKVIKDQIDHKLEYRRMILTKWLEDNECEDFEDAKKTMGIHMFLANNFIRQREKDPKKTERGRLEHILEHIKRMEFVFRIFNSERRFIEKYLRS